MDEAVERRGRGPSDPATIVLVDGSDFFRECLHDLLVADGHRCSAARDFAAAAPALAAADVAVLIFDLATAGAEGIAAFAALRARRPALRAIVLSGHADQALVLEALRAGACDYLAKPLHEEELRLSLARALAGWRAERELARLRAGGRAEEERASGAGEGGEGAREGVAEEAAVDLAREVCATVTGEGDAERVLGRLVEVLGASLGALSVALYLREPGGGAFERAAAWEAGPARDRARLAARGLTGSAVSSGGFVASAQPREDPRFDAAVDTPSELPPGAPEPALWVVPLRFRGRAVGLVRAFLPPPALPTLRGTELLAAALSAALRSVLLYRSWRSSIDELARIRRESARRSFSLPPRPPDA